MCSTFDDYLAISGNFSIGGVTVSVQEEGIVAQSFNLYPNYPNPFNPSTTLEYTIPQAGNISLIVYNLLGEEVTRLVDEIQQADKYNIIWEASNFSSGIYFYQLQAGKFVQTNKMLLLK